MKNIDDTIAIIYSAYLVKKFTDLFCKPLFDIKLPFKINDWRMMNKRKIKFVYCTKKIFKK